MKTRRFLAYLAMAAICCGVVAGCDDNDEPDNTPTTEFIYIDERTDEEKNEIVGGCGLIPFEKEGFYGYKVIATRSYQNPNSYQIFIPAKGADLNLVQPTRYYWMWTPEFMYLNEEKISFNEEKLGELSEGRYYYVKTTDYLTVRFDTEKEINFSIPANDSKKERIIKVSLSNYFATCLNADMIFIQAGK